MSALGQKQTCAAQKVMSALPPKADMCGATRDVRFVPKRTLRRSFDQLIGLREQALWHDNADCSRRWQVDDQFELGRLHDRHVGGFLALENATCIDADLSIANEFARAIARKTANFDKSAMKVDSRKQMTCCKRRKLYAAFDEKRVSSDKKCFGSNSAQMQQRPFQFRDSYLPQKPRRAVQRPMPPFQRP